MAAPRCRSLSTILLLFASIACSTSTSPSSPCAPPLCPTHSNSRPAFAPPPMMSSFVNKILYKVEGWVAEKMVNSDRDATLERFTVAPDSEYSGGREGGFDHSPWDGVMRRHVSRGMVGGITTNVVDYGALAADPDFAAYRTSLAGADLKSLSRSPNELLALYINAYNALCIGHVVRFMEENGGALPDSVKDTCDGTAAEVWDVKAGVVGGETVTLNDIEHGILRSRWAEPRVHASIVCASASCPNLRVEAFVPERLNEQMDDQAREWVSDPTKGVRVDGGDATFSRIFLWFKDDFLEAGGPVAWARKYLPTEKAEMLSSDSPKDYFPYNWSLNKKTD